MSFPGQKKQGMDRDHQARQLIDEVLLRPLVLRDGSVQRAFLSPRRGPDEPLGEIRGPWCISTRLAGKLRFRLQPKELLLVSPVPTMIPCQKRGLEAFHHSMILEG